MFCCFKKKNKIIPTEIIGTPLNNEIIDRIKNTKKIIFTQYFNYPIFNLPSSIESIKFEGYSFNHAIDNLPNNLKELSLSSGYNQPLDYLPYGLETLKFLCGSIFSHRLDNLPHSIKILEIPLLYNHPIDNLPENIEEIRIGVKVMSNDISNYFPEMFSITSNQEIEFFNKHIRKLPSKLKKLFIFGNYEHLQELKNNFGDRIIPISQSV